MEECCVVCAEPLEWVGYGVCKHRDVCSRCIARLRFVLDDKHCCICKQECSSVFVTKALGNYTKVIKDFESLGKRGDFWYEKNTQAFFDDKDHFGTVTAMCRLSCQVCEQAEGFELNKDFVKKGHVFKSLDLLQRHLSSAHNVQMCSLCLEGRKIFICEQKLYNKGQLERHLAEGDSEVDGIGEERGGFTGHPLCSFCRKRFYSDNELYQHMSVDHYLCHICQRLHPGQYEYFHNYDDLEVHFRHEHSLCEHPECLAKKFGVFTTDAELKRHNALTHGGTMSRSQRNTYLQIPVSFQYRRPPTSGHGSSSNHRNPTNSVNSDSGGPLDSIGYNNSEGNAAESSSQTEIPVRHESPRYLSAAGGNMSSGLEESAFPPLPGSKSTRRKTKQRARGSSSSVNGALQGSDRTSLSSSPWQRRSEDRRPCSSSSGTVRLLNKPLQASGEEACRERAVDAMNVTSTSNVANTALPTNNEVHDTTAPLTNGLEHGFQLTDEVRSANKALGECIRLRLGDDVELFSSFKELSAQFRRGNIDASLYCEHIKALGLWDLVPELARLCPAPESQKALFNAYNMDVKGKQPAALEEPGLLSGRNLNRHCSSEHGKVSRKAEASEGASAPSTANSAAALRLKDRGGTHSEANNESAHTMYGHCEPERRHRELLHDSKAWSGAGSSSTNQGNGTQEAVLVNGRVHADIPNQTFTSSSTNMWSCGVCTLENSESESKCAACEASCPTATTKCHEKRTKKVSKFERLRIDKETSVSPPLQLQEPVQKRKGGGVWKNGGGQRLVALAQRDAIIDTAWRR